MIQYIEIDSQKYPLLFGYRSLFALAQKIGANPGDLDSVNVDFDALLDMFAQASKRGAKKDDTPELVLSAEQLEEAMDADPLLFPRLQELFSESASFKAIAAEGEAQPGKKRKK